MKLLNRIKDTLTKQERTGTWLSRQIEKDPATVSRWCSNKQQPSIETLYKIAQTLDVDVKDLLISSKDRV